MNSDVAFTIGKTHNVCEDYATNYSPDGNSQIVLCDGCSSSDFSDIGARILALTIASELNLFSKLNLSEFIERIKVRLPGTIYNLTSQLTDLTMLDSTFLCVRCGVIDNIKILKTIVVGDGFVIVDYKNTEKEIFRYSYPSGYPRYLSYELNSSRYDLYKPLGKVIVERYLVDTNWKTKDFTLEELDYPAALQLYPSLTFEKDTIRTISLSSDGLESFTRVIKNETSITQEAISFMEVISKLFIFKTTEGKFVQRRLNRFKKDCNELGWQHNDDLSIATIAVE